MRTGGIADDLAWWRAHRGATDLDAAALGDLLARLKAWIAQHDADRARQPGPFLKMAWDGVFADEASEVAEAIGQIETALIPAKSG
ncbi:hypothetical protein [Phenylobacterium sp. SCN 70-31]|uniref:hypothetical protein n=1 Tax=Phenylobacterium sp. SCN 70-31 TaxID=1660129 RepID=UPI00086D71C1|nr:hypothetical protein [Phenylobacterium sp. SCN 70-31]ODT89287.1 MAG: hypothetical protein ABS78_03640 [Phenylobacterium sp. SCN 70-31]